MSPENCDVLVVDDSELDLDLTTFFLRQYFNVDSATSGEEALEKVERKKPKVVLLDVNMPDMDGYEACRKIRAIDNIVKIIFVSANNTTDEMLRGYDSGGNDYVVKPYVTDVLLSKVKQAIKHQAIFAQSAKNNQSVALEAMTNLGELGTVIAFLKSSFRAASIDHLANLILEFIRLFNIKACFQLRTEQSTKSYTTHDHITPIEEELLARAAYMNGRFAEKGTRMFVTYGRVSLMIKNLPIEDDLKVGRLRDNFAVILEAVDEKLALLSLEEKTQAALAFIQLVHKRIEVENSQFIEKTVQLIESAFARLGMTEEQETHLLNLISKSQQEFEENFKDTRMIEARISEILSEIKERLESNASAVVTDAVEFF